MKRFLPALLACVALVCVPGPLRAAALPARLDPRLAAALAPDAAPVAVWVEFTDKGERWPAGLAARLAQAERELTPENRSRRLRRGVRPLVDELDLPVAPEYVRALEERGLRPYATSRWMNAVAVRASGPALANLAALDMVRRVSPVPVASRGPAEPTAEGEVTAAAPPPGALGAKTGSVDYGMTATQMARLAIPALHDSGYVGAGVMICMLDDGFNYYDKHAATRDIDVGDRTRDFVRGGASVQDTMFAPANFQHGQWTLSAVGGYAPGVYVAPAFGARFALARTEDNATEKPIEMVNWLMGSEWADSLGADVISSSLGYFTFPDSAGTSLTYAMLDGRTTIVTRAAEIAAAKGIVVVNSAGNGGPGSMTLDAPADAWGDSMLAVGSVDSAGIIANSSSRGPTADGRVKPDVVAQGVNVLCASADGPPNVYVRKSGTSLACPLTAGVVACLLQARPTWTVPQLVNAIKVSTTGSGGPDNAYGWGLVNALGALHYDTVSVPPGPSFLRFALYQTPTPVHIAGAGATFHFGLVPGAPAGVYAVRLYDVSGRLVNELWSGWLDPDGVGHSASWDGSDRSGHAARAGLYFASLESGHHRTTLRLVTLR